MSPENSANERGFLKAVPDDPTDWKPPRRGPAPAAAVAVGLVMILVFAAFTALITFLAGPLGLVAAVGFATMLLAISFLEGRNRRRP